MKVILFVIIGLFIIASIYDVKYRIIPNTTSIVIITLGLVYHMLENGMAGLKLSLLGLFIGFVFFLMLYVLKMMGAGDVKLSAGAGSILGMKIIPAVVIIVMIGGLMAIIQMIYFLINKSLNSKKFKFQSEDKSVPQSIFKQSVPYGLAISVGTILTLIIY